MALQASAPFSAFGAGNAGGGFLFYSELFVEVLKGTAFPNNIVVMIITILNSFSIKG